MQFLAAARQPHPCLLLTPQPCKTSVNIQFSFLTWTPLQEFLQNSINFRLTNRLKIRMAENNVLLQEFHQIAAKIAKIAAFTSLLRKSKGFLGTSLGLASVEKF
ncbi:hypothetical protein FLT15_28320 [Paenibacillus thiaminolyticus]|uniref:hypothetical protein n=1 Tax=Paenibacillus thiaminolyticus TaxID=49283 RepID=UPI001164A644|nr:hypothetical protein [Paenibacillus thiaminolyticus]NGP62096.1 hypothetical protein [Paenibacillus thiaminolyticus]